MVKHRGKYHPVRCVAPMGHGACLGSMLPGVQVTTGLGFFLCSGCLGDCEDSNSLLHKGFIPKRGLVPL